MRTSFAPVPGASGEDFATVGPGENPAEPQRGRPLDLVHLSRQTFGDKRLETELLRMFMHQAVQVLASLGAPMAERPTGQSSADLLHMLVGSSRVVGASDVAALAESFETRLRRGAGADLGRHDLAALDGAITHANRFIVGLLEAA